jgi:DNA-binding NtrC family response regulator
MPDMDGATFYERMAELGIGDRFVLMTGGAYTPRATEFIGRGVCPSISKPFLLERLLTLLHELTRDRTAS